jgi:outer membrane protein
MTYPGWPGRRLSAGSAAFVLFVALASTAQCEDLLAVYRAALNSDPILAGERSILDASEEKIPEARSALLPALAGTGQAGRTGGPVTYTDTPSVDRSFNTLNWAVQLTMPLLRPGGIAGYRESRAQLNQAQQQFSLAEQDLILRVTQAYFDVLIAEESLAAADAEVKAAEEQHALARRSFEKGVVSVTDVDEAVSRAALASSQQLSAQTDVEVKRATLEKITGSTPSGLAALRSDAVLLPPEPEDINQWVSQANDSNAGVLARRSAVEVARLDVQKARMARLPSIDAVASYGRDFSSGNNTNPIDYSTNAHIKQGGIQVTLPLVDGGGMHAQIAEAAARQRKAEADLEAARRDATLAARTAYHAVISGIGQIRALRAAIDASINSVKGNQAGYKLGLRINSDVLDAQRQRYAAQRDLAKARYDTVLEGLKLKAAAGTLQGADLIVINKMLTAESLQ